MELPNELGKSPLAEAILEFRFKPKFPGDVVFGSIFPKVPEFNTGKLNQLPILNLPIQIRDTDPQLRFQAHYRLDKGDFRLSIGPNMIAISAIKYPGWSSFYATVEKTLNPIFELDIMESISRIGMRYVNSFPNTDIFEKINLAITMNGEPHRSPITTFRTKITEGNIGLNYQIANNAKIVIGGNQQSQGSIVDLDASIETQHQPIKPDEVRDEIKMLHKMAKERFFGIMKPEFLKSLEPKYSN